MAANPRFLQQKARHQTLDATRAPVEAASLKRGLGERKLIGQRASVTRICFRYRPEGRHVRMYDVQIVLDDTGNASRIEIRHAVATTDDFPPLSSGRLSAARLRTAVDLLGLIARMTSADRTVYAPSALVNIVHLKTVNRGRRQHPVPKPERVRDKRSLRPDAPSSNAKAWQSLSHRGTTQLRGKPLALALTHTTFLLARARRRYPMRCI